MLQHAIPLEIRVNPDGKSKELKIDLSKEYGFVFGPPALPGFAQTFVVTNPAAVPDGALIDFVQPESKVSASVSGKFLTLTFDEAPKIVTNVGVSLLFNGK